jgi:hypothetical protein
MTFTAISAAIAKQAAYARNVEQALGIANAKGMVDKQILLRRELIGARLTLSQLEQQRRQRKQNRRSKRPIDFDTRRRGCATLPWMRLTKS